MGKRPGFGGPGSGLGPGYKIEIPGLRAGSGIGLWVPEKPSVSKLNFFFFSGKSRKIIFASYYFNILSTRGQSNGGKTVCIKIKIIYFKIFNNTEFWAGIRKIPGLGWVRVTFSKKSGSWVRNRCPSVPILAWKPSLSNFCDTDCQGI